MKKILNIILFGISFLITLVVIDQYIKYAGFVEPSLTDYNEELGRCRRSNQDFTVFNEGFSMGNYNDGRYRGPYYPEIKNESTMRVALLGDSWIEGLQVFDREHMRSVIENDLAAKTGIKTEVFNFGRNGFDLEDIYVYKKIYAEKYQPDYILCLIEAEDLFVQSTDPLFPQIKIENDCIEIVLDPSASALKQFRIVNKATNYSYFLNMASNALKQYRQGNLGPKTFEKFWPKPKQTSKAENGGATDIVNIEASDRIMRIFAELVSDPRVILIRKTDRVYPNGIQKIIDNAGTKVISLDKTLLQLESQGINPEYWPVTSKLGHLNREGHQAVGLKISKELSYIHSTNQ